MDVGHAEEGGRPNLGDWIAKATRGSSAGWALDAGLRLAARSGYTPTTLLDADHGLLLLEAPRAEPFALAASAFTDLDRGGDAGARDRLVQELEGVLHSWRFILHFRMPLRADFDPAPVGRAVQLWIHARESGDGNNASRYAVYEDDGVSFEIWLTSVCPVAKRPLLGIVGPLIAEDRLRLVSGWMLQVGACEAIRDSELSVVTVVGAEPSWGLSRGHVRSLLYGTPRVTETELRDARRRFEVTLPPTGSGLFSDVGCRGVASVWWLERGGTGGMVRGWASDNPWCAVTPPFPGRRFARRSLTDTGDTVMAWYPGPEQWSLE